MQLKNKEDGEIYWVITEDDKHEGFMIYAKCASSYSRNDFCMHYRSLAEFNEDWQDVD